MTAEIATRDATTELVRTVQDEKFKAEIAKVLPDGVTPDRFARAMATAILEDPDLVDADRNSLLQAGIRCATDGLLPNGKEAIIKTYNTKVKRGGKEEWVKKAQYMPMIGGRRRIAAEHGWTLKTRVVYKGDEFEYEDGLVPVLRHKPARIGTTQGEKVAAYAIATHRDYEPIIKVLYPDDIARRRNASKQSNGPAWSNHEDAMWEKCAGNDAFDEIPFAAKDRERIERLLAREDVAVEASPVDALYGAEPATDAIEGEIVADDSPEFFEGALADGMDDAALVDESQPDDPDQETRNVAELGLAAAVPAGKLKGKTLGELIALRGPDRPEVDAWFVKALAHKWQGGFEDVVAAVCRVYAPDLIGE